LRALHNSRCCELCVKRTGVGVRRMASTKPPPPHPTPLFIGPEEENLTWFRLIEDLEMDIQ
jgi:hypothetical protein